MKKRHYSNYCPHTRLTYSFFAVTNSIPILCNTYSVVVVSIMCVRCFFSLLLHNTHLPNACLLVEIVQLFELNLIRLCIGASLLDVRFSHELFSSEWNWFSSQIDCMRLCIRLCFFIIIPYYKPLASIIRFISMPYANELVARVWQYTVWSICIKSMKIKMILWCSYYFYDVIRF